MIYVRPTVNYLVKPVYFLYLGEIYLNIVLVFLILFELYICNLSDIAHCKAHHQNGSFPNFQFPKM